MTLSWPVFLLSMSHIQWSVCWSLAAIASGCWERKFRSNVKTGKDVQNIWKIIWYEGGDNLVINDILTFAVIWLFHWGGDAWSNISSNSYCLCQLLVLMKCIEWLGISYHAKKKKGHEIIQLIWWVRPSISQISSTCNFNKMWWVKFLCVNAISSAPACTWRNKLAETKSS